MSQWEEIYKRKEFSYYDLFKPHSAMGKIARIFRQQKVKKVLDLGCGSGRNMIDLLRKGFSVDGIDNAPTGIRLVRKQLKEDSLSAGLKVRDIYEPLPYADGAYDAVICVQVLQHAVEKRILSAIREMERVLRPGGLLFVTLSARISKGKVRYCLVKTARKIAPHTYVPTIGDEAGLTHFIYTKDIIHRHFARFRILELWRDERDYYCFIAERR